MSPAAANCQVLITSSYECNEPVNASINQADEIQRQLAATPFLQLATWVIKFDYLTSIQLFT